MSLSSNFPTVGPVLNLDFVNNQALDPRVTFTRASTATYFDYAGVLQTAQNNIPRFDYNPSTFVPQGLLIEESRTNSIRNNTMVGAAAGTPGTLPTNWTASSIGGVSLTQVVGTGTENGITYIDVRFAGTTSSTAAGGITTDGTTQIAALLGQTWASSFYIRLVGGSTSGITNISNTIQERDAGGVLLIATNTTISPTGAALNTQRVTTTRTLNNASTAFVNQQVRITPQSGVAIDITLRIGLPQLEQGAFATSVIPTTTTALTRSADAASMTGTNFSSWYNQSEGTFLTVYSLARPSSGSNQFTVRASDNGYNNAVGINTISNGFPSIATVSGGVFDGLATAVTPLTANVAVRFIGCYATNDLAVSLNGAAVVTDTSATIPTGMTRLDIGSDHAGFNRFQSGYIQRIAYYNYRVSNAQLQALTGS